MTGEQFGLHSQQTMHMEKSSAEMAAEDRDEALMD